MRVCNDQVVGPAGHGNNNLSGFAMSALHLSNFAGG